MPQLGKPSMACIVAWSRQIDKKKQKAKKKTKEKLIVMSCTWKIRVGSKWKSRSKKMGWENVEKLQKTQIIPSLAKELFFSLGNCVWNEKWQSFIILSLM